MIFSEQTMIITWHTKKEPVALKIIINLKNWTHFLFLRWYLVFDYVCFVILCVYMFCAYVTLWTQRYDIPVQLMSVHVVEWEESFLNLLKRRHVYLIFVLFCCRDICPLRKIKYPISIFFFAHNMWDVCKTAHPSVLQQSWKPAGVIINLGSDSRKKLPFTPDVLRLTLRRLWFTHLRPLIIMSESGDPAHDM